jgi:hypothetical protein
MPVRVRPVPGKFSYRVHRLGEGAAQLARTVNFREGMRFPADKPGEFKCWGGRRTPSSNRGRRKENVESLFIRTEGGRGSTSLSINGSSS